jgi:hypothetical protein
MRFGTQTAEVLAEKSLAEWGPVRHTPSVTTSGPWPTLIQTDRADGR